MKRAAHGELSAREAKRPAIQTLPLLRLPEELIVQVVALLPSEEAGRLALCCRRLWYLVRANMRSLRICKLPASPERMDYLTQLLGQTTAITELDFRPGVSLRRLPDLALTRLTRLRSVSVPVDNQALAQLPQLTSLELGMDACRFDSDALARMTNLRTMGFFGVCWTTTKSGLQQLSSLTTLHIDGLLNIDDETLRCLTQLTTLKVRDNRGVSDHGLSVLTNLTALDVAYHRRVSDRGLAPLTNLTQLNVRGTLHVTDRSLATLTKLRKLRLSGSRVTDEALGQLQELRSLCLDATCDLVTWLSVTKLQNLTALHIRRPRSFEHIPAPAIATLPRLRRLTVGCDTSFLQAAVFASQPDLYVRYK